MTYLPKSTFSIAKGTPDTDAFGRLRVSENHILLSSQLNYDLLPLIWETSTVGAGSSVAHMANEAAALMTVGPNSGDAVIRQTKRYYLYRAGQGHLVLATFAGMGAQFDITKRVGYFDDNDGIYFEVTGSEVAIVRRTSTSGSPSVERVLRASWNGDKLDGTGPSGVNLDFDKAQILAIDLQWLGVGTVRVGFDTGNGLVFAHTFRNQNSFTSVYMKTGSLPVRYEIRSTAASVGGTFKQICSSVVREGGDEEEGLLTSFSSAMSPALNATTTLRSAISLRLRSTHIRAFLRPLFIEMSNISNAKIIWRAVINPTLTGVLSWSNYGQAEQVSTTQLTYTAGTGHCIGSGSMVSQGNTKSSLAAVIGLESILGVAANIAGTSDILSLIVESDSGTAQDFIASVTYLSMF